MQPTTLLVASQFPSMAAALAHPAAGPVLAAALAWACSPLAQWEARRWLGFDAPTPHRWHALANAAIAGGLMALIAEMLPMVAPWASGSSWASGASGATGAPVNLGVLGLYVGVGTALAATDLRHQLLPDSLTALLAVLGGLHLAIGPGLIRWEWLLVGMVAGLLPRLWVLLFPGGRLARAGLGSGDLALLGALVVWLGPVGSLAALLLAAMAMLPVVAWGMAMRGWTRKTALPLGPALVAAGAVLQLLPLHLIIL